MIDRRTRSAYVCRGYNQRVESEGFECAYVLKEPALAANGVVCVFVRVCTRVCARMQSVCFRSYTVTMGRHFTLELTKSAGRCQPE